MLSADVKWIVEMSTTSSAVRLTLPPLVTKFAPALSVTLLAFAAVRDCDYLHSSAIPAETNSVTEFERISTRILRC